jgi:hypothetical protein
MRVIVEESQNKRIPHLGELSLEPSMTLRSSHQIGG